MLQPPTMTFFKLYVSTILTAATLSAQSPEDVKGFAPVSVSSANYRETPREVLIQRVGAKSAINPEANTPPTTTAPSFFVFIPGEIFPADMNYEAVCAELTVALAKKNYINAADAQGVVREPEKVTLMLRVNYGVSLWRLPVVRTEHITWDEGLVGKPHDSRSLTHLGGDIAWDSRAGGNDDALDAGAKNEAAGTLFGSSLGSASGAPAAPTATYATGSPMAYDSTREFNLVVIDAFNYAELKAKGKAAKALWTTFVAAPVMRGQKFSQVFKTMLRTATPYWGDTTLGMQVFNDARAEVKIGEAVEVKTTPPPKN